MTPDHAAALLQIQGRLSYAEERRLIAAAHRSRPPRAPRSARVARSLRRYRARRAGEGT
ncbi:hypothetical protein [Nitriliruptor alkaliphilus]|uniref:hypothetical protein n=1 Tax=Nitriliruptor alkaliphilus TaxID=427918 RepID=UPI0012EE1629|nr:hypothetical protein [Nitriliruptor alkaliphilus]